MLKRVLSLLARELGLEKPTQLEIAIGALVLSLRDWKREVDRSRRRQRREREEDED